jgi:hypothetical protein
MTSASASRVTRSSRSLWRAVLLFLGVLAFVAVLRAQETPRTPPAEQPAATEPSPAAAGTDPAPAGATPTQTAPAAAGKATNPPAATGPSPARFEPTEKVRADFDVSFPIDI